MKKLLALLMLFVMSICFVSCGSSSDVTPEPEPTPSEPEPAKDEQLVIGFNCNDLINETMSFMTDVFYKYGEENNIKIMVSQDGNDTAKMQDNLENFVAGGVDGVILMNYDPTGIEPILLKLKEKGIAIVSYDEYSEIADYSFLCSNYDLGYAIGKSGAEWANEHVDDDKIVMGLMAVEIAEAAVNRSNGIEDGFLENCPRGEVFRAPADFGDLVGTFYSMLSARPDIKICCSLGDQMVVGVAEAWYADLVADGIDTSEYGIFGNDATDIALNLIKKAKEGEGIFRSTIDLGLKDRVPLGMIQCCHAAILGKDAPAGYEKVNYYEVKYVNESNIDEYSQYFDDAA